MNEPDRLEEFLTRGWCRFERDDALARWTQQVHSAALAAVSAPENAKWLRCGGTWFVGANVLPNEPDGAVAGGAPLAGRAVEFIRRYLGSRDFAWDRGQVSVAYAGYPRQMESETAAAFRFRVDRDAAHVDGVSRAGSDKRRYLRSCHAFILGIPMDDVSQDNSPLVVWERSHEVVRKAFREYLAEVPAEQRSDTDVADLYGRVRREIFASCRRVCLTGRIGEAWLVHRLALHGIAPWTRKSTDDGGERMVVYFRPELHSLQSWLDAP